MKKIVLLIVGAVLVVGGVTLWMFLERNQEATVVTGTLRFDEETTLPPGSVVSVQLRTSGRHPVVATYDYTTNGEQMPLPFSLTVRDDMLWATPTDYAIEATVAIDGEVRFATREPQPLRTTDPAHNNYDVVVASVNEEGVSEGDDAKKPAPPNVLAGTSWEWFEVISGTTHGTPPTGQFILSFAEHEVQSTTDCNSLSGTYVTTDVAITFSPLAMTKMYCKDSRDAEYATYLSKAVSYTLEEDVLTIRTDDGTRLRFRTPGRTEITPSPIPAHNMVPSPTVEDPASADPHHHH